jgi:hypothetical protein
MIPVIRRGGFSRGRERPAVCAGMRGFIKADYSGGMNAGGAMPALDTNRWRPYRAGVQVPIPFALVSARLRKQWLERNLTVLDPFLGSYTAPFGEVTFR